MFSGTGALSRQGWEMTRASESMGHRIKRLRERRGITQMELALIVGIRPNRISELERGLSHSMHAENLARMADYFEVSTAYLLSGQDTESEMPSLPTYLRRKTRLDDRLIDALEVVIRRLEDRVDAQDDQPLDIEPLAADTGEDVSRALRLQRERTDAE